MPNKPNIVPLKDLVNGNMDIVFPLSLLEAIKVSPNEDTTLVDILKDITPIVLSRAEYEKKLADGELDDDTYYYVPDGETTRFEINDITISKSSTFSSKKLAEMFASVGVNLGIKESEIPSSKQTLTLKSDNWNGDKYRIMVNSVTDKSTVIVDISNKLTDSEYDSQYDAYKNADIRRIKKSENMLEFISYGTIPTSDIVIDVTII